MKTVQTDFNGIRVALDCANGSASVCAQRIFEGLGAKCIMLNDKPDGTNINKDCGSTHIEGLQRQLLIIIAISVLPLTAMLTDVLQLTKRASLSTVIRYLLSSQNI